MTSDPSNPYAPHADGQAPAAAQGQGELAQPEAPSFGFRMLQVLVWGMGFLLIFGMIGLAYMVNARNKSVEERRAAEAANEARPAPVPFAQGPLAAFEPGTLPLPAGTRIQDMELDGSTLMLHLTWSDGVGADGGSGGLLWFYDVSRGEVVGELQIP